MSSLWGEEFKVDDSELTKKIVNKINKPKQNKVVTAEKMLKSKSVSLEEKLNLINSEVVRILGHYKDNTEVIKTKTQLHDYISDAISNGIIAVDTETNNSLDTITCKLMGGCIYTPNRKNAYIPINHTDLNDNRLDWQLTEKDIYEEFSRLDGIDIITHNGKFDYEVLYTTTGWKMPITWDTMIGCKLLDENEPAGLKGQYISKIDNSQEKYSIDHLFTVPYNYVDPDIFALYAATDSFMTHKLYEYQKKEFEKAENKDIYNLLKTIEIPIISVVAEMELRGIEVDCEYAEKISKIYHERSEEVQSRIDKELEKLEPTIRAWRNTKEANVRPPAKNASGYGKSKNEQLASPVELSSPTQMAILLYDVLKVGIIDKKNPRGTGADILEELSKKVPICKLLVEKRGVDILINTFIDKMPSLVKEKTGRLHANFNTYGADTGRFSSSDPNLQNIPSHAKDIRLIFKAKDDYCIVGADFSAQEPRSLASFSHDKAMLQAYEEGKDLYAVIGSKCFNNNYEDNLEFHPVTHVLQPEGKARRGKAKVIQLAISYSMSAKSLSESIDVPIKEAQRIIDDFYKGFPGVKKFTDDSQNMLKTLGYVTDMWGRRRHLSNATLPEFSIESMSNIEMFNPIIGSKGTSVDTNKIKLMKEYHNQITNLKFRNDINALIEKAKADGISITDNRGYINRALRQCLNARIQGTAASMTKAAMILIDKDKELNDLGFKLLITVHDEVFGECPRENAERASERLSELMVEAAKSKCECKFKCDGYVVSRWYEDEFSAEVKKDYEKLNKDFSKIVDKYSMIDVKYLQEMCNGTYECGTHKDI